MEVKWKFFQQKVSNNFSERVVARRNLDIWFTTTKHDQLYLIHFSKITPVLHGFVRVFLISNFNTFLYMSIRHIPCARKILSLLKSLEDNGGGQDSCSWDDTKAEWSCSSQSTRSEEKISEKEHESALWLYSVTKFSKTPCGGLYRVGYKKCANSKTGLWKKFKTSLFS